MVGESGIADRGANSQSAISSCLNLVEGQTVDVEDLARGFDVQFHQVHKRGPASDESDFGALLRCFRLRRGRDRRRWVCRSNKLKDFHGMSCAGGYACLRTCWIAAMIFW